jgi:tRNA(Ile)-lysidine synthase
MERECGGCPLLLQHAAPSCGDVDSIFANRMQMAGITPHDRIAIAVSGGPDSMALCILTARWLQQQQQVKGLSHSVIEEAAVGMMMPLLSNHVVGMVVDHGLRPESAMEALSVQHWLARLGMECQVLKCNWVEGVPTSGHLQEAARNARYNLMEQACRRHSIRILLMAHHADDQAELFMMRMARGSGVIGLAGMAFISSIFPRKPLLDGTCDLLLIRPLLDLTKHDLYRVCEEAGQEWIEDPTNRKQIFARNCIRQALEEPPFDELRVQIQRLIAACRKTRALLDKERDKLLQDIVSVSQDFAFATINLGRMSSSHASDALLGRVLVAVLQFIAQREKPPRGRALQKLMDRIQLQPLQAPILSC